MSLKYAVMLSGSGTNFQSIADHIEEGKLPGEIVMVISNRSDAFGLKRAQKMGLPAKAMLRKEYDNEEAYYQAVGDAIEEAGASWIFLAGFMRILPESFVKRFENHILNIHPSLIPKYSGEGYYGERVHKAVIDGGEKESGATVHYVDAGCDTGEIILQEKVAVDPSDDWESLAKKVLEVEHRLYPKAIRKAIEQEEKNE